MTSHRGGHTLEMVGDLGVAHGIDDGTSGREGACAGAPDYTCRISVDLRELNERSIHALRLLLAADVLRRFLEVLQGRQVFLAVLKQAWAASVVTNGLGIRDPEARATSPDEAATVLGGQPAFLVEPARPGPRDSHVGVPATMQIGAVRPPGHVQDTLVDVLGEHDPAVLRLVLLRFAPTKPATLSAARLNRGEETLQRWRYKTAMWADMPSAPPVPDVVGAAREALGTGLDTVTARRTSADDRAAV